MDELPALAPSGGEVAITVINIAVFLAVAIASYRRSRCLSRYPVWKSLVIAVAAGAFWVVWLLVSVINRDRLAREWSQYRHERDASKDRAAADEVHEEFPASQHPRSRGV